MLSTSNHPSPSRVGAAEFKQALRHFASGVTIITTYDATGAPHGMTATAFSSLSLDPPLVLIAVSRETRCHAHIVASGRFGISVLHEDQAGLSRHFGGTPTQGIPPAFATIAGMPVLEMAMVTLVCALHTAVDGGDHSIFIGAVETASTRPGSPLIHFDGRYRRLAPAD